MHLAQTSKDFQLNGCTNHKPKTLTLTVKAALKPLL